MTVLTAGRLVAAVLSLTTLAFLVVHDSLRADNIFLVPDLVICALLLVAAALPARYAPSALVVALAMSAGVFLTSVASYLVRDELGLPSLLGAVTALATAVLLGRQPAATGTTAVGRRASR